MLPGLEQFLSNGLADGPTGLEVSLCQYISKSKMETRWVWGCLTYANDSHALDAVGKARWLVLGVFLGHGLDTIGLQIAKVALKSCLMLLTVD